MQQNDGMMKLQELCQFMINIIMINIAENILLRSVLNCQRESYYEHLKYNSKKRLCVEVVRNKYNEWLLSVSKIMVSKVKVRNLSA